MTENQKQLFATFSNSKATLEFILEGIKKTESDGLNFVDKNRRSPLDYATNPTPRLISGTTTIEPSLFIYPEIAKALVSRGAAVDQPVLLMEDPQPVFVSPLQRAISVYQRCLSALKAAAKDPDLAVYKDMGIGTAKIIKPHIEKMITCLVSLGAQIPKSKRTLKNFRGTYPQEIQDAIRAGLAEKKEFNTRAVEAQSSPHPVATHHQTIILNAEKSGIESSSSRSTIDRTPQK